MNIDDTAKMNKTMAMIGVLLGGDSQEREVSLLSGQAVYQSLLSQGVNVTKIDIKADKCKIWIKQIEQIDFAFVALHGRGGEDGKLQGLLEMMNIPYTGSSVSASAIAMNKLLCKQIWELHGLSTPAYRHIKANTDLSSIAKQLGFPLMVKPAHEGSSIGISKVNNISELELAYIIASKLDDVVIAEQWVTGSEYTASILNGKVLPLIKLETPREFYDYEAKYQLDNTNYHCPCKLDKEREQEISTLALKAFNCIGGKGWGRVDFMLDNKNKPWLIELNTVPGLTSHSLVPMAAKQAGINFDELINQIMKTGV